MIPQTPESHNEHEVQDTNVEFGSEFSPGLFIHDSRGSQLRHKNSQEFPTKLVRDDRHYATNSCNMVSDLN